MIKVEWNGMVDYLTEEEWEAIQKGEYTLKDIFE